MPRTGRSSPSHPVALRSTPLITWNPDNVRLQSTTLATLPSAALAGVRTVTYSGDVAVIAPYGLVKFTGSDDVKVATDLSPATERFFVTPADAQVTRPADTTPYSVGDLIANSVTAGSVVPLSFTGATSTGSGGAGRIVGWVGRCSASVSATVRFHFLLTAHAVTNGDNGALLFTAMDVDNYLGSMDVVFSALTNVGAGTVAKSVDIPIPYTLASGDTIYVFMQAVTAHTPTSASTYGGRPIFEVWA